MPSYRTPQGPDALERARYFPRQAVRAADLSQDHDYLVHRLRRHNRLLHGWGVWNGTFGVTKIEWPGDANADAATYDNNRRKFEDQYGHLPFDGPWDKNIEWFLVKPGYALTPLGEELFSPRSVYVNVTRETDGALVTVPSLCPTDLTPTRPTRTADAGYYLFAEAIEAEQAPVRAPGNRCGDHPDQFEPSRFQDAIRFSLVVKTDGRSPDGSPYPDLISRLTGSGLAFDGVPLARFTFDKTQVPTRDKDFKPVAVPGG